MIINLIAMTSDATRLDSRWCHQRISPEILFSEHEPGNEEDHFAVAVMLHDDIVGHIPRTISRIYWHFIQDRGTINKSLS